VTCTPQLYNVTDDATTAGSALTTGETRQDIVVPSASGVKVYEGRVALSGATEKDAWVTMQAIREQV
jgi:hypothetical protein